MGEIPNRETDPIDSEYGESKSEHLAEGIRPIMACIGTKSEYNEELSKLLEIEEISHNVDYFAKQEVLDKKDFKNAGQNTYVISVIDSKPKFTKRLFDCTSVAVVGRETGSETEISFLTHQDPTEILAKKKEKFIEDFEEKLKEMKEKCLEGSIDIAIAGGQFGGDSSAEYKSSVQIISLAVENIFGFEPTIVSGPKAGEDDIYFDTANRRLYVIRPQGYMMFNDTLKPSELDAKGEKWEKERREKIEKTFNYKIK